MSEINDKPDKSVQPPVYEKLSEGYKAPELPPLPKPPPGPPPEKIRDDTGMQALVIFIAVIAFITFAIVKGIL